MLSKREKELIEIVLNSDYFEEIWNKMAEQFYTSKFKYIPPVRANDNKVYNYFRRLIYSIRRKKREMEKELELIKKFEEKLDELGYGIKW